MITYSIKNSVFLNTIPMEAKKRIFTLVALLTSIVLSILPLQGQERTKSDMIDSKVKKFLAEHEGQWYDMNVPRNDGELLYDLVIKGNYTRALEIGTSTGYSGIYIAWALSKTGGKLITIDIDEQRHKTAVQNFREAGLSEFIDARLADAHDLVKELKGPFDFVFSDADKNWYRNYFDELDPKLVVGGCYATHNISDRSGSSAGRGGFGNQEYLDYIRSLENYSSELHPGSSMLVSYKQAVR